MKGTIEVLALIAVTAFAADKAADGENCEMNDDCQSGWCNMWAIPHTCNAVDVVKEKAADGENCDMNDDCQSGWCNMWAIPHVCGGDEEVTISQ